MYDILKNPPARYERGFAITHSQVNSRDPLRFFVTDAGIIIVNPKIMVHTNHPIKSMEGCLTYPFQPKVQVDRWNKCVVRYLYIDEKGELSDYQEENLNGTQAIIFQHEIDHFNGKYVYDEK